MARRAVAEREVVKKVMPAVVQIVALRQAYAGHFAPAWTGSGTLVHPQGVILTNCHVANPRAMGIPAPPADALGVAVVERSDQPPVLTYVADIVAQVPKLDLAVLRIVADVNGRRASNLKLPWVPLGDSDELELGDVVSIFGFPGIGGETITFTSGSVSGFMEQRDIVRGRAWVKTDATIAGGNSGGTAVNTAGFLVGIPTQAAAGSGIMPVDARPVVDTTGDGIVDHNDTPMAIGGFINGLRPVNLAKPLLEKVGVVQARPSAPPAKPGATQAAPKPGTPGTLPSLKTPKGEKPAQAKGRQFTGLVFSEQVASDGRPVNPSTILSPRAKQIYASFAYDGMRNGTQWGQSWTLDGRPVHQEEGEWQDGPQGRKTVTLRARDSLPEGRYQLVLSVRDQVVAQGDVVVGRQVDDTDTEVSGQVMDRDTKRGIPDALVIALNPGVRAEDFVREQRRDMAFVSARTDSNGRFTFSKQLPKGQAYGLIVVARGYRDMAIDSALRIGPNAPDQAQIHAVQMIPD
jgi:S1-C subfamily serine protease